MKSSDSRSPDDQPVNVRTTTRYGRKIGRFILSMEFFQGQTPEEIEEMFAQLRFVPLHVQAYAVSDMNEYIGTSPYFEFVEEGCRCPNYDVRMELDHESATLKVKVDLIE